MERIYDDSYVWTRNDFDKFVAQNPEAVWGVLGERDVPSSWGPGTEYLRDAIPCNIDDVFPPNGIFLSQRVIDGKKVMAWREPKKIEGAPGYRCEALSYVGENLRVKQALYLEELVHSLKVESQLKFNKDSILPEIVKGDDVKKDENAIIILRAIEKYTEKEKVQLGFTPELIRGLLERSGQVEVSHASLSKSIFGRVKELLESVTIPKEHFTG